MRLRICRTDGRTGSYVQEDSRRVHMLAQRLNPQKLFCSGPIVIGVLNPFSVLNPDEVCWVEVEEGTADMSRVLPPHVEQVRRLSGRPEYEEVLARQWPRWRSRAKSSPGDLLEALVELSFRGGAMLYLHVTGTVEHQPLSELVFGQPAITATFEPGGIVYANPKCVARARVYHSMTEVPYPQGLWCAEADDI